MPLPLRLRALQLDLGRQMEPVAAIRELTDFAARFGYNALHLYLEAAIRTPSFPYPDETRSYSLDEMREVVEYAATRGVEVIPQINSLGHMENFLCHEELAHLAEVREPGVTGRFWGTGKMVVCPSLPATREFLAAYLTEVAEVFPSRWFAVGLDEVWDMGRCSLCRKRLAEGESLDDLFADHIRWLHELVTGTLGKRMLMWDDLLEELPAALDQIPTDIVQLVWQYGEQVERTKTHFGWQRRDLRLAEFDRRGIEYMICPADGSPRNTETLTQHALGYQPIGGVMTVWEKAYSFMHAQLPTVAYAGRLWSGEDAFAGPALFKATAAELLGIDDAAFLDALYARQVSSRGGSSASVAGNLRGPVTPGEVQQMEASRAIGNVLGEYAGQAQGSLGKEILTDVLTGCEIERTQHRLRWLVRHAYQRWAGQPAPALETLIAEGKAIRASVIGLRKTRAAQWARLRGELPHKDGKEIFEGWEAEMTAFVKRLEADDGACALLTVRYALPDYYGAQKVVWKAGAAGDDGWRTVYEGMPKPRGGVHDECPYYTIETPLPLDGIPERLRLETYGYGGIGVAFVEIVAPGQRLVPGHIVRTCGLVGNPEALLSDDTFWCQLGELDVPAIFHEPERADAVHALELAFRE